MHNKIHILVLSLSIVFTSKNISAQTYQWAKGFGSTEMERSLDLTTDNFGNVYTVGHFSLTIDFDPGTGIHMLTAAGSSDFFISVLDMNGDFLWAHNFGGNSGDYAHSVTLDNNGNVLITGRFSGTVDFDPGPGVNQVISNGNNNFFILKLNPVGNFLWVKTLASTIGDFKSCVESDSSENIYLAGEYNSTSDFDPGSSIFNLSALGNNDVFILKLDSLGNFIWAKSLSGYGQENCQSVDVDSTGNVYTTGSFSNIVDFDPSPGVFNLDAGQSDFIFISKLDSAGNFVWAKNFGGTYCWGMTIDSIGSVYSTGTFNDTADFDPGPGVYTQVSNGTSGMPDAFISKLDANGNFVWARALSGAGYKEAHSICVGHNGNVYTTGFFSGIMDFDPSPNIYNLTPLTLDDVYLSILDSSGNFLNALAIDGANAGWSGSGETVAVDPEDNLFLTGNFRDTVDFNPPFGANIISNGNLDVFVIKFGDGNVGIPENQTGNGITVYPNPGNGNYAVDLGSAVTGTLSVANMLGQVIINEKLVSVTSYQLNLETANGIYFLRIFEESQCYTVKLIKN